MSNTEHAQALTSPIPTPAPSTRRGHIGLIVVGSLAAGLAAALLLVWFVSPGAAEPVVTGSAMLGFGFGWAMLAALSVWRTDQPQRRALVPAARRTPS